MALKTPTVFGLLALLAAGLAGTGRLHARSAEAPAQAPTPGQLAIVDEQGRTTGLCPLKHTSVTADISGFVARVNVRQEFENSSREPVEAVYTFPLPEDAAVDEMTMTIGRRVVRGEVKRREEARQIYEAARAEGRAAALLDQERPNIFTQSVANLMPGEKVSIAISYVNLLKYDEGRYEFTFPMVVGPRFVPGFPSSGSRPEGGLDVGAAAPAGGGAPFPSIGRSGIRFTEVPSRAVAPGRGPNPPVSTGRPDGRVPLRGVPAVEGPGKPGGGPTAPVVTDPERILPPIAPPDTRAGHDISLTVNLDAGLPLAEVKSPLHAVKIAKKDERRATVTLKSEKTLPNKDFILRFTAAGERMQTGLLAHAPGGGSGYFTLILQPPAAPAQKDVSPKEMIFVIDQTGSQRGEPIKKAKETMRYCLENLNPGDTFQLIGFNTAVHPCFSSTVPVTPDNMQRALAFLEPLEGNGGTDILKCVDHVLSLPADPARPRIICYMTDGYVGNDMQILSYIRERRGQARMFPFGIGQSVNRFLIEGMAREGRGAPYFVTLNTPGEQAAAQFYARVAKPLLLDPVVEWNGLPVADVYPKAIPDVFSAGPIVLKGRYTRAAAGEITVRGLLRGRPWSQTVSVQLPEVEKGGAAIPTLWARERIEELQSQDWLGAQRGQPDPRIKEAIVGLALDYRLMSQHTSFVAVEEKVVNIGGRQRRIHVPVELPEGVSYEGIAGIQPGRMPVAAFGRFGAPPAASPGQAGGALGAVPQSRSLALSRESLKAGERRGVDTMDLAKRLSELKPERRREVVIELKLAPSLRALLDPEFRKGEGAGLALPNLVEGRLEVQVWLTDLPEDGLKKLRALGFTLAAELKPRRLVLGTARPEQLAALAELPFVLLVELPRYE